MKKGTKRRAILLSALAMVLLFLLVYHFPLQKSLAEKKYEAYSGEQGAAAADIKTKEVFKDYKQGGYFISVTYHSDPDHRYLYHYFPIDFRNTGVKYNVIYCDIYGTGNDLLDHYDGVRYQPLHQTSALS